MAAAAVTGLILGLIFGFAALFSAILACASRSESDSLPLHSLESAHPADPNPSARKGEVAKANKDAETLEQGRNAQSNKASSNNSKKDSSKPAQNHNENTDKQLQAGASEREAGNGGKKEDQKQQQQGSVQESKGDKKEVKKNNENEQKADAGSSGGKKKQPATKSDKEGEGNSSSNQENRPNDTETKHPNSKKMEVPLRAEEKQMEPHAFAQKNAAVDDALMATVSHPRCCETPKLQLKGTLELGQVLKILGVGAVVEPATSTAKQQSAEREEKHNDCHRCRACVGGSPEHAACAVKDGCKHNTTARSYESSSSCPHKRPRHSHHPHDRHGSAPTHAHGQSSCRHASRCQAHTERASHDRYVSFSILPASRTEVRVSLTCDGVRGAIYRMPVCRRCHRCDTSCEQVSLTLE